MVEKSVDIRSDRRRLKRELTLLPLFCLIYFTVCSGSFGVEPMVGLLGSGLAIALFFITLHLFTIPKTLMVREMQSMMPVEGGYYHWMKKVFGPFVVFMGGWLNWVVAWVDVSISYGLRIISVISYLLYRMGPGSWGIMYLAGSCYCLSPLCSSRVSQR
jgi:amino acid transporter